jgi:hypothetical protein
VRLGVLFWFYRDVALCENRLRLIRRRNPGVPVFGLYGGPAAASAVFESRLHALLDDFWSYPDDAEARWKWRNGDLVLTRWFAERGEQLEWDHVFVAQWDMVVTARLSQWLPAFDGEEMLVSGVRPVSEVESWWRWTRWEETRAEYDALLARVTEHYGPVDEPMCCQFIGLVVPRRFFACYRDIEDPELGFLEYKVPIYAQAFGIRLVPDAWFRPWWPEEPVTGPVRRRDQLMHAWGSSVRLPSMMAEALRPGGRRAFHPYRGVYPHDLASVGDEVRLWTERRQERSTAS